ncbi:hypothetical protein [Enterococcus sp. DIV0212c]|nr:hypothetical protein [Enterococcus sp. DIV0212c]
MKLLFLEGLAEGNNVPNGQLVLFIVELNFFAIHSNLQVRKVSLR